MARRRIDPRDGAAALAQWAAADADAADAASDAVASGADAASTGVPRSVLMTATRYALEELEALYPGHSVEVRVPPAGAVQAFGGPRHTRGTPPNVVECRPGTFLRLATGRTTWDEVVHRPIDDGGVQSSGIRADLTAALPFLRVRMP